jgi:hypothetical protein
MPAGLSLLTLTPQSLTATPVSSTTFTFAGSDTLVIDTATRCVGIRQSAPEHALQIAHTGNSDRAIYVEHTQSSGSVSAFKPIQLYAEYRGTDAASAATNVTHGISSTLYYGGTGTPTEALGTGHSLTSEVVIRGSGSQSNEFTPLFTCLRADLGTGYNSPSTTPGRYWGTDQSVLGPIAIQPGLLNGMTMLVNNYYNGSPSSQPSAAAWFVTKAGSGGGLDTAHTNGTTYPVDIGVGIVGQSSSTGVGFTTALKIGGTGSGWSAASRFTTAISIQDWESYGLRVAGRYAGGTGPAISVASGTGPVVINADAALHATSKLEVIPGATSDPLVNFGQSTSAFALSVQLEISGGTGKWFIASGANQFLTGTAGGDVGMTVGTSGKKWHVGGTSAVMSVTQDNKIGFFRVTPVVQQTRPVVLADVINLLVAYGLSA